MTSSGTGAGVPDRKCKGAPRGMEALLMLFHATILARIDMTSYDNFAIAAFFIRIQCLHEYGNLSATSFHVRTPSM